MSRRWLAALALAALAPPPPAPAQQPYVPPPGEWARRRPADAGFDSLRLDSAVRFALASEIPWQRDLAEQVRRNTAREPYPDVLGPTADRGGPAGLVIRGGYIVAEWGDTRRVDMTFSVAKSYLSVVAGLAFDRGLIPDVHARVGALVRDGGFDSPHNAAITWHHLFTQTSEWEGTLWDKPDVADRRRGRDRALNPPGTFWEYNDVRVNRTALALLRVWNRPLPDVLREHVMVPIGASDTWIWHGYRNSYVELDGRRVQSVSGGGHWGGGMWASTLDHARFGLLLLRRGAWGGRRILSERWIALAETPEPLRPVYGYLWWLNTGRAQYAAAPASSVFALGAGGNVIWIDRELDLVVVTRWMDTRAINAFMGLVLAAMVRGGAAR
jgi:CubicO group peptidase (beta-lactamase class C family)